MKTHHLVLIGGALLLFAYAQKTKAAAIMSPPIVPGSTLDYTTQQSQAAAQWWNAFPSLYVSST